jgi:hypothetical protein
MHMKSYPRLLSVVLMSPRLYLMLAERLLLLFLRSESKVIKTRHTERTFTCALRGHVSRTKAKVYNYSNNTHGVQYC